MAFIAGFLFGWFVLGLVALIGLEKEWYSTRIGFWVFLTFPAIPVAWLVVRILDRFR